MRFKFPRRSFSHCVVSLTISNCSFVVALRSLIHFFHVFMSQKFSTNIDIGEGKQVDSIMIVAQI
jgi:hypothetical protein